MINNEFEINGNYLLWNFCSFNPFQPQRDLQRFSDEFFWIFIECCWVGVSESSWKLWEWAISRQFRGRFKNVSRKQLVQMRNVLTSVLTHSAIFLRLSVALIPTNNKNLHFNDLINTRMSFPLPSEWIISTVKWKWLQFFSRAPINWGVTMLK